jgi:bifunctional DNase/RNase
MLVHPRPSAFLLVLALSTACILAEPDPDLRSVEVARVAVDSETGAPVVILRERDGLHRQLPIWIGIYEARSIALGLEGVAVPRPNPHDLMHDMIETLGGELQRVVVTELRDSVYYAVIHLVVDGRSVQIDARPSDAIAVALRFAAPLFVDESVLNRGSKAEDDTPRQDV